VAQRVGDDDIAFPHQRRDHPEVRHVAGVEGQRGLGAQELGELLLERLVGGEVPVDQARPAGRAPQLPRRASGGLRHLGMARQVQVVSAGEEQYLAPVDAHPRALGPVENPHAPIGAPRSDLPEHLVGDGVDAHSALTRRARSRA
jgi:hypothetical protein